MNDESATVIDSQANVQGKLTGKDARILGRFQGEIELSGRLRVGEAAQVEATVKAEVAEISGKYNGDLSVKSLLLLEKARVSGSLAADSLAVREGAIMEGTVSAGAPKADRTAAASRPGSGPAGKPAPGPTGRPGQERPAPPKPGSGAASG